MKNEIYFGDEAREKLLSGMEKVYKAVKGTLGSRGRHVALTRWGSPRIVNDGVTIAKKINLEDQGENMGADYIKEVAIRTNEEAGDGTTTATILAYSLITNGFKLLKNNPDLNPMNLRKELEKALESALKKLSLQAIPVKGDDELIKIANISSDSPEIAELVTKAFKEAGETGRVFAEESQGLKTEVEKIEGMEVEGGYISPYFVTNPDRQEAIIDNPYILVTDHTFNLQDEILPLMEEVRKSGCMNLVVVCKDVQGEALGCMVGNKLNGKFNCFAVKAPRDPEMLRDLAALCGKDVEWTSNGTMQKAKLHDCTRIRKVIATRDKTVFIKGDRNDTEKSVFNVRVETIKNTKTDSPEVKNRLSDRLARITSSVVLIRVGGASDNEITYQQLKIDDAINAVKSAVKEGYVTGGGVTLNNIGLEVIRELKTIGAGLLHMACCSPIITLIENSGIEVDMSKVSETDGFNTETGHYEKNLLEKGIIDPVLVEKRALSNAVALASLVLTLDVLIVDLIPKKTE